MLRVARSVIPTAWAISRTRASRCRLTQTRTCPWLLSKVQDRGVESAITDTYITQTKARPWSGEPRTVATLLGPPPALRAGMNISSSSVVDPSNEQHFTYLGEKVCDIGDLDRGNGEAKFIIGASSDASPGPSENSVGADGLVRSHGGAGPGQHFRRQAMSLVDRGEHAHLDLEVRRRREVGLRVGALGQVRREAKEAPLLGVPSVTVTRLSGTPQGVLTQARAHQSRRPGRAGHPGPDWPENGAVSRLRTTSVVLYSRPKHPMASAGREVRDA
jgi:hypothetical protein